MLQTASMFMDIDLEDHQATSSFCLPGNSSWFRQPQTNIRAVDLWYFFYLYVVHSNSQTFTGLFRCQNN